MRTFRHAKLMASTLRTLLAERGASIGHAESLEIVARQFGLRNWNILAARIAAAERQETPAALPKGWSIAGTTPGNYAIGLDAAQSSRTEKIVAISCLFSSDDPDAARIQNGFGTLMQAVDARPFIGKRLRFSALLKTRDVPGHATIWMRVDDKAPDTILFDNLMSRPADGALTGTSDWTARQIVFQIPEDADSLHYGLLLTGMGTVWAKTVRLEVVDDNTPPTATRQHYERQRRVRRVIEGGPQNLDFSDIA